MRPKDIFAQYLDRLSELYGLTGHDWELRISHSLTEPTCPIVSIAPDGSNTTRFMVHADTIQEGIEQASELVYREVVLGQSNPTGESPTPWTNSDDEDGTIARIIRRDVKRRSKP